VVQRFNPLRNLPEIIRPEKEQKNRNLGATSFARRSSKNVCNMRTNVKFRVHQWLRRTTASIC